MSRGIAAHVLDFLGLGSEEPGADGLDYPDGGLSKR